MLPLTIMKRNETPNTGARLALAQPPRLLRRRPPRLRFHVGRPRRIGYHRGMEKPERPLFRAALFHLNAVAAVVASIAVLGWIALLFFWLGL